MFSFIPKSSSQKFLGNFGLKRQRFLLNLLQNPQNKLKVIHVAGTSGKGSTAYLISLVLSSLGFKVGLHLSPHLIDIRERIQINNSLIFEKKFLQNLNEIIPFFEKMRSSRFGPPSYFEILVALAFYSFDKERVDYAIIETGMGGLYDGTNTVENSNKISVITRIGLDHTEVLGSTIEKIALQKAGIINKNSTVISALQEFSAKKVIQTVAKKQNAKLIWAGKEKKINLGLKGDFQQENCALALKTVSILKKRDGFIINYSKINPVLQNARFFGRFDVIQKKNKTIVLDGAHNPQKMSSFIQSLKKEYSKSEFIFVLAFKKNKDFKGMIDSLLPFARKIILTSFFSSKQDMLNCSCEPKEVADYLKSKNFCAFCIEPNSKKALVKALREKNSVSVVTGSLYLLSEIYLNYKL